MRFFVMTAVVILSFSTLLQSVSLSYTTRTADGETQKTGKYVLIKQGTVTVTTNLKHAAHFERIAVTPEPAGIVGVAKCRLKVVDDYRYLATHGTSLVLTKDISDQGTLWTAPIHYMYLNYLTSGNVTLIAEE